MAETFEPGAPSSESRVVVFAGPTLPREPDEGWQRLLARVELRPPAQRGDVLNALCYDPEVLVILDGYYFTVPSVTHKEILYALESGVRVLGGASMGALRAAELYPFGMEGVGWVFEQFRHGHLDGDDEVAVLHASEEFGYRPLTVALVDVRAAMENLHRRGIEVDRGTDFLAAIKALPFSERHGRRIERMARQLLGKQAAGALWRTLKEESVKERDAQVALERALSPAPPRKAPEAPTATTFLGYFQEWHLEVPGSPSETRCTFRQAAHAVQVLHPEARELVTLLRRRLLLAAAARRQGLEVDSGRVEKLRQRLEGELRNLHGGPLLPASERLAEARELALGERALQHFGSVSEAMVYLAAELGLDGEDGAECLESLLALQDDLLPAWWIARGIACSTAFPLAVDLARAADQIHRAFQTYKEGARICKEDLKELAAELWGCSQEEVAQEAGSRGLFDAGGFSPGLREAVELIAAAERLPRAINHYPRARRALRHCRVFPLIGLSAEEIHHGVPA